MKLCVRHALSLLILLSLLITGCATRNGSVDLTERGIYILSPRSGQVIEAAEIPMDIRVSGRIKRKGKHLHVYVDGDMYSMVPLADPVQLTGLADGSHRVEVILTGHKGHSHMETAYKDAVVFIVQGSHIPVDMQGVRRDTLPEGLGYDAPEEVFHSLFSAVITHDENVYKKILGGSYTNARLRYRKEGEERKEVISISEIVIKKTGREELAGVNLYFIKSTQKWKYSDGSVKKHELDLHFREIGGRWIYYPMKGTPLL